VNSKSTARPTETDMEAVIATAIGGRRLLDHPFYQRWLEGTLDKDELAAYAAQYRYFEAQLPSFLGAVLEQLPEGRARELVAANLSDELSEPAPHLELFDSFATAVGATPDPSTPATEALVACYARWAGAPAAAAIGALATYEVQAAEVAASKAAGLRDRFGLDAEATEFWDVHASVDVDHATWVLEALGELTGNDAESAALVQVAAEETAAAWWGFLDEREACRPVAA
jgi:pyrroloquinoline-quinone synthase